MAPTQGQQLPAAARSTAARFHRPESASVPVRAGTTCSTEARLEPSKAALSAAAPWAPCTASATADRVPASERCLWEVRVVVVREPRQKKERDSEREREWGWQPATSTALELDWVLREAGLEAEDCTCTRYTAGTLRTNGVRMGKGMMTLLVLESHRPFVNTKTGRRMLTDKR